MFDTPFELITLRLTDVEYLQQVVGVTGHPDQRNRGFRNRLEPDRYSEPALRRLVAQELVAGNYDDDGTFYYRATRAGCRAAGLNEHETTRAMGTGFPRARVLDIVLL